MKCDIICPASQSVCCSIFALSLAPSAEADTDKLLGFDADSFVLIYCAVETPPVAELSLSPKASCETSTNFDVSFALNLIN